MAETFDRAFPEQYMLRMPAGMRDTFKALAKANKRSMNAEIVAALEAWLAREQGGAPSGLNADDETLLLAVTGLVSRYPGLSLTLSLRDDDADEPAREIGADDLLASVGEVEGGPAFPRRVDGDSLPLEERERIQKAFDARRKGPRKADDRKKAERA